MPGFQHDGGGEERAADGNAVDRCQTGPGPAGQEDLAVPLVMAGYVETPAGEDSHQIIGGHFNGKLDRPRIHAVALDPERAEGAFENPRGNTVVAAWNFQEEITGDGITRTRHITDVSLGGLVP